MSLALPFIWFCLNAPRLRFGFEAFRYLLLVTINYDILFCFCPSVNCECVKPFTVHSLRCFTFHFLFLFVLWIFIENFVIRNALLNCCRAMHWQFKLSDNWHIDVKEIICYWLHWGSWTEQIFEQNTKKKISDIKR